MMSPEMIRQILLESEWQENKITQHVLVPCFNAFSMRNSLKLRDIRFVGGASELGNDIEFYELFGPDLLRFYTGVQVKRGTSGRVMLATSLARVARHSRRTSRMQVVEHPIG